MRPASRLLLAVALPALVFSPALAQQAPPTNPPLFATKPLIVSPFTGDDRKEIVLMTVSIQPTGAVPLHTHPGDCVGSVIEGDVELLVEGQPARRLAAGEAYGNPRGTVHGFRNAGGTPAKLLNSMILDKGAPRIQPAVPSTKP